MPQPRGLTLRESGLTVQVYVAKDNEPYEPYQGMDPDTITDGSTISHKPKAVLMNNSDIIGIQFFVSTATQDHADI